MRRRPATLQRLRDLPWHSGLRAQHAHCAATSLHPSFTLSIPPPSPTTAAYYYNKMSHETTWVKPVDMLASMAESATAVPATSETDSDSAPY